MNVRPGMTVFGSRWKVVGNVERVLHRDGHQYLVVQPPLIGFLIGDRRLIRYDGEASGDAIQLDVTAREVDRDAPYVSDEQPSDFALAAAGKIGE
jgi:hypothetical protein